MLSPRVPHDFAPNPWSRALERRRAAGGLLDLTEANPTSVGLGGAGVAELQALADARGARYAPEPCGLAPARAAVAGYHAARGAPLSADRVVLTSGTSESYAHLFRLLAGPSDTVLVPVPSYPLFEPIAALEDVRLVTYRLAWDGAWHLDRASLERGLAERPRAVIVVQPHHPTGFHLDAAEMEWLEDRCARHDAAIVSDEVFGDFPWPGTASPVGSFAARSRAVTFTLSGISKVCGMPQLKLGWIAVSGPPAKVEEARRGLEWICDLFLSVGAPVQNALPALLEARHRFQARVRERLGVNLERLRRLVEVAPEVTLCGGGAGWAALLRLPQRRTGEAWALALLERGVALHPGHFYDLEGESWLVASLIPEPAVFDAGLERLSELLARDLERSA